jgi:hypothetical protein
MVLEVYPELKAAGTTFVCYSDRHMSKEEIGFECTMLPSPALKEMVSSEDVPVGMRSHLDMESVGSLIYTSGLVSTRFQTISKVRS